MISFCRKNGYELYFPYAYEPIEIALIGLPWIQRFEMMMRIVDTLASDEINKAFVAIKPQIHDFPAIEKAQLFDKMTEILKKHFLSR